MRSARDRIKIGANLEIGFSSVFQAFFRNLPKRGPGYLPTLLSDRDDVDTRLFPINAAVEVRPDRGAAAAVTIHRHFCSYQIS
jgi:hypothetical protein